MEKSASTPAVGSAAEADTKKKYNVKQFKPLLGTIKNVHKQVEDERHDAKQRQLGLEARMKESEAESSLVQKELSVQLRCAGRSYQQLLGATRELTDSLRTEEDRRITEIEALEKQVKDLKTQLGQAAKPWKEEVSKRDLKIIKLQEAAADQEARLRKSEAAIAPIKLEAAKEIKARDDKTEVILKEIDVVRAEYEEQLAAKDVILEKEQKVFKDNKVQLVFQISELNEKLGKSTRPYEKTIKELELKVQGLEQELGLVDYGPYEMSLKKRELAYDKLVKDFRIKQQLNQENIDRSRAGFELTLERMDKRIQENERDHKKRLAPWQELVEKREAEILKLNGQISEMKGEEEVKRKAEEEVLEDVRKELEAAKKAEEMSRQMAYKLKAEVAAAAAQSEGANPMRKVTLLNLKLEEITKQCEAAVRSKDREIKQKIDLIQHLQKRTLEEAHARDDADKEWDARVQQKEEGYGIVCANLAHTEGQIVEERARTATALATVKKREQDIQRLNEEHTSECRQRLVVYHEQLQKYRELEVEFDDALSKADKDKLEVALEWENRYDFQQVRQDEQIKDLRLEIVRRERFNEELEKELKGVRKEFERARTDWQEKERELEIMIRGRDRQIIALKNEIEFINDSWEIKYNRLMGIFEQLQKKYEESIGPNGPQEAYRRARDLKIENMELNKTIHELHEVIKKKTRQIRELRLDYDILVKETADVIAEKERGMAEMVGDMAKLEAKLRKEVELKERLVKEMTSEKIAIVTSFEGRIRELEQQIQAMLFTDRQELVDTIDVWKRAYERACIERDEMEDAYKELLDTKDQQVKKMGMEYAEVKEQVKEETEKGEVALEECEQRWLKLQAHWGIEREKLQREIDRVQKELHQVIRERDREKGIADDRAAPDPELDILRAEVKKKEEQLLIVEAGIQNIVDENQRLMNELELAKIREETVSDNWEPQIRWRDERYAAMVKEHESVKEILTMEMLKAHEALKTIEDQVRKFPSPFEQELKEAEDKYSQSQAGLVTLSKLNIDLKEKILDATEDFERKEKELEDQLAMAVSILQEVASLGALKGLSKSEINDLEQALGVDLDGDGGIG